MAKPKKGSRNLAGTLEKHGDIWLARWTYKGKRFSRSTGCKVSGGKKAKEEALAKLEEYTRDFNPRSKEQTLNNLLARLKEVQGEIAEIEEGKPALTLNEGWEVYYSSQSRPRSGAATLAVYERQYFLFVAWVKDYHAELTEMRDITPELAAEYAQYLLAGTPKEIQVKIHKARKYLADYARRHEGEDAPELGEDAQRAMEERRRIAALTIRQALSGNTFNKHMNTLTLIWRHVARHPKARLTCNPWNYNADTGEGIRRIVLSHAERPHSRRALTFEEAFKVLATAQGELRTLLAIGVYTGLRLGDAALLQWGNIDRATGYITVRSRKTDTETRTAIHPTLARILDAAGAGAQHKGYIMPHTAKEYLSGATGRVHISQSIRALFESTGIETRHYEEGRRARSECGFHSLRHTFITMLRMNGAQLHTAQSLAGHKTAQMTEHYTHDDGRAILALPDLTQAAEPPQAATEQAQTQAVLTAAPTAQAASSIPTQQAEPTAAPRTLTAEDLRTALGQMPEAERAQLLAQLLAGLAAK